MKWNCPKFGREFSKQKQEHFCIKPQNIDEYIAAQAPAVQPKLREMRAILQTALPDAQERIVWMSPSSTRRRRSPSTCA